MLRESPTIDSRSPLAQAAAQNHGPGRQPVLRHGLLYSYDTCALSALEQIGVASGVLSLYACHEDRGRGAQVGSGEARRDLAM